MHSFHSVNTGHSLLDCFGHRLAHRRGIAVRDEDLSKGIASLRASNLVAGYPKTDCGFRWNKQLSAGLILAHPRSRSAFREHYGCENPARDL